MLASEMLEQAPAERVMVDGSEIAYRVAGADRHAPPLVLLQRFRGTMDDWDPAFVGALAATRPVVRFDNRGIGASDGEVQLTLDAAADDAASFAQTLGFRQIDVLGWSMGGMTAQLLAIRHPGLVRRLVLAGTTPSLGSSEVVWAPRSWLDIATRPTYTDDDILDLFFTNSAASRAAGRASLARMSASGRPGSRVKTTMAMMERQSQAVRRFVANEGDPFGHLRTIPAPTLVANGDRDGAFPVIDSVVLAREIRGSQLAIYPDAGHAFHFQDVERVTGDIDRFLTSDACLNDH